MDRLGMLSYNDDKGKIARKYPKTVLAVTASFLAFLSETLTSSKEICRRSTIMSKQNEIMNT